MKEKKFASSIPACNMIIALLIFAQIPIMFGKADPNAIIYALPWLLACSSTGILWMRRLTPSSAGS